MSYFKDLPENKNTTVHQLKGRINRLIELIETEERDGDIAAVYLREISTQGALIRTIADEARRGR